MKKIDLHIHTKAADRERSFDFDLSCLQEYVRRQSLDCIAITNHNEFDRAQFEQIQSLLDVLVLPGIEVDVEGGQILVISEPSRLDAFSSSCESIAALNPNKGDSVSVDKLADIFGDLSCFLLIPHYDKQPSISSETLAALGENVTAGEVASPKKFIYCVRNQSKLVPVYFSDVRIETGMTEFPVRQTYVACNELSLTVLKSCLRDKSKVALSPEDGNDLFQIFDDGQQLSTGLNVVLGERSTGKSHTLERIFDAFPNAKYLEQFSLVARDEQEDEKRFNQYLSDNQSLFSRDYLSELRTVVNELTEIDLEDDARSIERYLESLKKHANETEKRDAFSNATLFNEDRFSDTKQSGLEDLIASTQNLIENVEYRDTIDKHISTQSLRALIVELIETYCAKEQLRLKKKWVNELVSEIKAQLQVRSAATPVSDLNLYDLAMNRARVRKFEQIVNSARKPRELMRKPLQGFELVAKAGVFRGAGELKLLSRRTKAFSGAFEFYDKPYQFLKALQDIEGLPEAELYRYFVKIDFKILNQDGYEASGGERSEFNLLQAIQDAQKNDMLLIDEPESSFDNIFLKNSVNEIIREIAKSMPVVLVTHNNTVGSSINPNYVLYTRKNAAKGEVKYQVFSGFPTDKVLTSRNGETVKTWDITMGCLEAGPDAYEARRKNYEDIRD